jgi:hypothetical protein
MNTSAESMNAIISVTGITRVLAILGLTAAQLCPSWAQAGEPNIQYVETNGSVHVLDVQGSPEDAGTTFYVLISNKGSSTVSVYLRADGSPARPDSGRYVDPWSRFSITGGSTQWVSLPSAVTATGYTLQVSFGHVFALSAPSESASN